MIHNTKFAQFIPPTDVHLVTGTWTMIAGQVAGTIVLHKAATAETTVVTIPIVIPSNSVALNGAKLTSIEIDYEVLVAACTTVTSVINKVTRGIEGTVAVVAAQTFTQSPTAANSALVEQHKLVLTLPRRFGLTMTNMSLSSSPWLPPPLRRSIFSPRLPISRFVRDRRGTS
jgi:hypothetical protein